MRPALALCLILLPAAAFAEEEDRGLSLMERGAQMFMEGILKEMEPAIDEFAGLADQMGPALKNFAQEMGSRLGAILEEVEDWSVYEAPEILPNGDIIIRRKPDTPEQSPEEAPQIDL
ncbi:hypothetical protein [Sulfitobacter sp. JB4-11]|uniref:hypothetical protein n=1 Tax=Sulfitobacter rhodophyticola TaxID=3238304 RepID=UPI003517DD8F